MRQIQKIFITMTLLTLGVANADCSNLVGDYSCAGTKNTYMDLSLSESVDDQGGTYHIFNMVNMNISKEKTRGLTFIADGTDRVSPYNWNYNASCQNDEFVMTSSALDGTDPQTLRLYLREDIMFFSMTKLDEGGVEQTMDLPLFCSKK